MGFVASEEVARLDDWQHAEPPSLIVAYENMVA